MVCCRKRGGKGGKGVQQKGKKYCALHSNSNRRGDRDVLFGVTHPDEAWTEYVSGGVTFLRISSTKHKERPLR
nr:hypothetical protein [Tanacetum cinerariifolium]